jgi:hypothetical protein
MCLECLLEGSLAMPGTQRSPHFWLLLSMLQKHVRAAISLRETKFWLLLSMLQEQIRRNITQGDAALHAPRVRIHDD